MASVERTEPRGDSSMKCTVRFIVSRSGCDDGLLAIAVRIRRRTGLCVAECMLAGPSDKSMDFVACESATT